MDNYFLHKIPIKCRMNEWNTKSPFGETGGSSAKPKGGSISFIHHHNHLTYVLLCAFYR